MILMILLEFGAVPATNWSITAGTPFYSGWIDNSENQVSAKDWVLAISLYIYWCLPRCYSVSIISSTCCVKFKRDHTATGGMNHRATLIQVHVHIDSVFETITLNCEGKGICALHIGICLDLSWSAIWKFLARQKTPISWLFHSLLVHFLNHLWTIVSVNLE
jgi:hypothetical protein